jgi:hypothetical protein
MFSLHIRRLAGIAVAAAAFAALVPVAQADPGLQGNPDAYARAVAARQVELSPSFRGSPDSIDRNAAAREARKQTGTSADASLRHFVANDNRGQAIGSPVGSTQQTASGAGFDWNDFGIGASAGVALTLLLGVGIGVLVVRHGSRRVTTA